MTQFIIRHFIPDADNVRDAQVRERYGVVSGIVGIFCNVFLFAIKLIIGLITGSISIAADAVNNLSDGLSSLISVVGFKLAGKAPDSKHPFGYGRTEYLAGLAVGYWADKNDVIKNQIIEQTFEPSICPEDRDSRIRGWNKAVKYSFGWAKEN